MEDVILLNCLVDSGHRQSTAAIIYFLFINYLGLGSNLFLTCNCLEFWSPDGSMVTHLLGLLPTVSEDSGARNALWSILQRVCQHLQARPSEMPFDEQASLMAALADGSSLLMDDLDDHRDDDEHEDEERASGVAPSCGRQAKLATVSSANQFYEFGLMHIL